MALEGVAEPGAAETFYPAWWFEPFGISVADLLKSEGFQILLKHLRPPLTCSANRSNKPFALPPGEPDGVLLVTPMVRSGLAVLMSEESGTRTIRSMWPFVTEGTQQEVEIERVTLAPNRLEAMIDGVLPSGLAVTWHDVHFAADRAFYATGSVHEVLLAGIAHSVGVPENAPITIAADNEAWSAIRAHTPENFNPDGSATLQTKGMAAMIPREGVSPELCEVQGPVRKVEPYTGDLFRQPTWIVTVTVFRDADANGDLNLPVYVTEHVLAGRPLPGVGDDFGALVRLVGRIWQPNVREAAL